jgi:glycosyltransferase involved in cell wall biosynthesis
MQRIKLKGIDIFTEIAGLLPDYNFLIIGMKPIAVKLIQMPSNVKILDHVKFSDLRDFYSKAKVYAQFSMREGLPSVVCEAMLCESIPVGTDVNGIPTAIGDCGFILKNRNSHEAAALVKKAMESSVNLGLDARKRIIGNFSNQRREKTLLSLLQK